jgi:phage-related protein
MSADGEINVQVNAEGVDEATGEMDAAGGGGGGDGEEPGVGVPGGGGGGASSTKLLGSVVALLSFLKPITDILGVVSGVLQAFVAPLAITLLRLLQPALSLLLKILPAWLSLTAGINSFLEKYGAYLAPIPALLNWVISNTSAIQSRAQGIIDAVDSAPQRIVDTVQSVRQRLSDMWATLKTIPSQIVSGIRDALPSAPDAGGFIDRGRGLIDRATDAASGGDDGRGDSLANVIISGGLTPFVDQVTRDGSTDLF